VLVEILTVSGELVPAMLRLLSKGLLGGRQQTQNTHLAALGAGERSAFGRQRVKKLGFSGFRLRHREGPF
jgi:hypothetical protein